MQWWSGIMLFKKEIVLQYKHSKSMNVQRGEFMTSVFLFDSSNYVTIF